MVITLFLDEFYHNKIMELYAELYLVLTTKNPKEKVGLFKRLYEAYQKGNCEKNPCEEIVSFTEPSYQEYCIITEPKNVPRRTQLGTLKGQILLLHAIAHIEYSAIDLALDAVYRFRDHGETFIQDWLSVAHDEVKHFEMVEDLLLEAGSYYGEIPVHNALFEASTKTLDLLERMAIVPRYLEANGLDATPQILKKINQYKDDYFVKKIINVLNIILYEEIDHVRKGDKWFEYACALNNVSKDIYFDIVNRHYPKSFPRKIEINCSGRLEAGFALEELKKVSFQSC